MRYSCHYKDPRTPTCAAQIHQPKCWKTHGKRVLGFSPTEWQSHWHRQMANVCNAVKYTNVRFSSYIYVPPIDEGLRRHRTNIKHIKVIQTNKLGESDTGGKSWAEPTQLLALSRLQLQWSLKYYSATHCFK